MSKLFNILSKAGFSVRSTGDDIFPATLLQGNEPIGFLSEDLNVTLISDKEHLRPQLVKPIEFADEYRDFDISNDQYVIAEYKDTIFTAFYDFSTAKSAFNICHRESDGTFTVMSSGDERETVAQGFAKTSGLISGKGKGEATRQKVFLDAVKAIGLSINEKVSESNRKYEICDSDNNVVGYINHRNNLTFVTADKGIRNALSNAFDGSRSASSFILPPFVEKLKNTLKGMGLVLKANFGTDEPQYKIQEPNGTVVGTMDNEKSGIQYSQQANIEHVQNIERFVNNESLPPQQAAVEINPARTQEKSSNMSAEITSQDIFSLLSAIARIPGISEYIPDELQAKIDDVMIGDNQISITTEQDYDIPLPTVPPEEREQPVAQVSLSPHQEHVLNEFNTAFELLQTFQGLKSEDVAQVSESMLARFGTDDKNVFISRLMDGKFKESPSLSDKIADAQSKADMINQKPAEKAAAKEMEF